MRRRAAVPPPLPKQSLVIPKKASDKAPSPTTPTKRRATPSFISDEQSPTKLIKQDSFSKAMAAVTPPTPLRPGPMRSVSASPRQQFSSTKAPVVQQQQQKSSRPGNAVPSLTTTKNGRKEAHERRPRTSSLHQGVTPWSTQDNSLLRSAKPKALPELPRAMVAAEHEDGGGGVRSADIYDAAEAAASRRRCHHRKSISADAQIRYLRPFRPHEATSSSGSPSSSSISSRIPYVASHAEQRQLSKHNDVPHMSPAAGLEDLRNMKVGGGGRRRPGIAV